MILKRNFDPVKVLHYVRHEMVFALVVTLAVYFLFTPGGLIVAIPYSIAVILGSALAIFIAFRNNTAYSRWWEARTIWGGIVNSSRILARLILTFTESHRHQANYDYLRSEKFKKEMIYLLIAWVHSLRLHLRGEENWSEIRNFLPVELYHRMMEAENKPNHLFLFTGEKIYDAMSNGTLGGFDSFQMEGQLANLSNFQGGCERIKNTPLLRQYNYFTKVFLYSFIFLFPFCIVSDFIKMEVSYLMIPASLIISLVFSIINKVGEVNEDPFENRITDVPLSALCNTIERDLKQMLGEGNLPPKWMPVDGYLY